MKNIRNQKSLGENPPARDDANTPAREGETPTEASDAGELYSELGERVYEVAGTEEPIDVDTNRNRSKRKGQPRAKRAARQQDAATSEPTVVPDGAFSGTREIKTPEAMVENQDETAPYQEPKGSAPFDEGDKVRDWTTGVGEQEDGEPTGCTTTE